MLQELVHHILDVGQQQAQASAETAGFGLMYKWHDKHYLGAGHGGSSLAADKITGLQTTVASKHTCMSQASGICRATVMLCANV